MPIYAVIIAGGRGKRFWPVSTLARPKFLITLPGHNKSLLQMAYQRARSLAVDRNIFVITNKAQCAAVKKQLPQLKKPNIISEPQSRNTLAAIAVAARMLNKKGPDSVMLVLPADQFVIDEAKLKESLKKAISFAGTNNALVTIGIQPTHPATGFGYIKTGKKIKQDISKADAFTEKPSIKKAIDFLKSKSHFWNSGIFVWKASLILEEIKRYAPWAYNALKAPDLQEVYKKMKDISVDYAVMEKSKKVCVVKSRCKWHDIGSWKNLSEVIKKDKDKNIIDAFHLGVDTKNCIIIGKRKHFIGTVGIDDMVIVHTDDATLICKKSASEAVKKLVEKIESKKLGKLL